MSTATGRRLPYRVVALPTEHGAWALLAEPALLGLLLVPSWAGLAFALAATAALLAQHPLSLALADGRRGRSYPRTRPAWFFAAGYGSLALIIGAVGLARASDASVLLPALAASPLALLQLRYDVRNRGRRLTPELAGAASVGSLAAVVALAGGAPPLLATSLWGVLVLRSVPSILYVRTRLALEYGRPAARWPALAANGAAVALAAAAVPAGVLPVAAPLALTLLAVRAGLGLSPLRRPARPATIGLREAVFGLITVLAVALGFGWGG